MKVMKVFDAILVHGYWLSQKGENSQVELSLRSKLVAYAAALLYKDKIAKNIILPAGYIWGKNVPSIADLIKEELVKKYDVPEDKILVSDEGLNTKSEIVTFLKIVEENNFEGLGDLSFATHQLTIPIHYNGKRKVEFLNVEDVIFEKGDNEHKKILKWLKDSRFEFNFLIYQILVRLVQIIDPDYRILGKIADKTRNKKSHNNVILPFFKIDAYDL